MNKCANNDNSCSYILYRTEDGTEVKRNKKKFETSDIAIITAKKINAMEGTIHKLVAYKCSKCGSTYSLLNIDNEDILWVKSFRR